MSSTKYIFYLEIALADPSDSNIYAFENLSHIPTSKLIQIFGIDLKEDPNIAQGYFLTKDIYTEHEEFLDKEFGSLNFDVFEYCLRLYSTDDKGIRLLYKESLLEWAYYSPTAPNTSFLQYGLRIMG